ncbi:RNA polymerase I transcription factor subunit Rrn6 [Schizosaccharomyces cryophilus OY26]|uniref:RNA polymerase I transcription factor subunit Rrn6 n=1 Tax=Schizosaccharomyces cryophilus (strain OY26 / ATCC MYA-4695 / CBS 11777 / NBRC 106824 / NRRL Y48691) TaxID=653667 RepID=S9VR78_SCHCR|nr:RNA polymerase I transcription factor subunit Rrn6 [Schizosaccharomyces cryophilus OY26]EPY50448.1 RNA polymerase I transcription factor subunit Rrn6 [Schizosaccharomyces cryophilus OY26]
MSTWPIDAIHNTSSVHMDYGLVGAAQLLDPYGTRRSETIDQNRWTFTRFPSPTGIGFVPTKYIWKILPGDSTYRFPKIESLSSEATSLALSANDAIRADGIFHFIPHEILYPLSRESHLITEASKVFDAWVINTSAIGVLPSTPQSRFLPTRCFAFIQNQQDEGNHFLYLCKPSTWMFQATSKLQSAMGMESQPFSLQVPTFYLHPYPSWKFREPILQVMFGPEASALLYVRTATELVLFKISYHILFLEQVDSPTFISAIPLRFFYAKDVYDSDAFAHMSSHPSDPSLFGTISTSGDWKIWQILEDGYREYLSGTFHDTYEVALSSTEEASKNDEKHQQEPSIPSGYMYRIIWECFSFGVLLANEEAVVHLLPSEPSTPRLLYKCQERSRILQVSSELLPVRSEFFLLTTDSVIWMDLQQPLQPLLVWKHHRNRDPTLRMTVCATFIENIYVSVFSQLNGIIQQFHFSKDRTLAVSSGPPFLLLNNVEIPVHSLHLQPCYFIDVENDQSPEESYFDSPFWSAIVHRSDGSLTMNLLCEKSSSEIYELQEENDSTRFLASLKYLNLNDEEKLDFENGEEEIDFYKAYIVHPSVKKLQKWLTSEAYGRKSISFNDLSSRLQGDMQVNHHFPSKMILTLADLMRDNKFSSRFGSLNDVVSYIKGTVIPKYLPNISKLELPLRLGDDLHVKALSNDLSEIWISPLSSNTNFKSTMDLRLNAVYHIINCVLMSSVGFTEFLPSSVADTDLESSESTELSFISPFQTKQPVKLHEDASQMLKGWNLGKITTTYNIGDSAVDISEPLTSQTLDFNEPSLSSFVLPSSQIATVHSEDVIPPSQSSSFPESSSQATPIMSQVVTGKFGARPKKKKKRSGF